MVSGRILAPRPACYNRIAMGEAEDVPEGLPPDVRAAATELVWRCSRCGYLLPRAEGPPDRCPDCGAPREDFYRVTED